MRKSKVLKKLRAGKCAFSTQVGSAFAAFTGMAASIGFDCIWLDMEHKPVNYDQVRECIMAATIYDADTLVRIRKRGYLDCFRPLEDGATGIMLPHCMSPEEALWAARNSKFYPDGLRGMDFSGLASDYKTASEEDCLKNAETETITMVQIEDVEALEKIDEIAAVDGIDILFVGPADLKQSALKHGIYSERFISDAYARVNNAASGAENTWWGTVALNADDAKKLSDMGARFINISGDFIIIYEGFKSILSEIKNNY